MTKIINLMVIKIFFCIVLSLSILASRAKIADSKDISANIQANALALNQVKLNKIVIAYQNFCLKKLFSSDDSVLGVVAREIKNEIFN